jgi:HD-like signal output (HDOD) protein
LQNLNDPSLLENSDGKSTDTSRSAETIDRNRSRSLSPGEALLEGISHNTDFPTFSKHIIEINRQISSRAKSSSASDLSNTILKDYALTGKLLKMVNSAFYSVTGGKVTTITRAVVLIGYEAVQLAATQLLLFDLMKSNFSGVELKEAFVKAFWGGLIAKDAADTISVKGNEEAFICAMLHDLGQHIVLLYLPEKWDKISNLILNQDFSKARASKAVLGISFENLGIAVAKRWKFPARIINSMERLSGKDLQNRKGRVDTLQALSNFSNELCSIVNNTNGDKRKESISELADLYQNHVPLSPKQLGSMIDASLEQVKLHADLIEIDLDKSKFLQRLNVGAQGQQLGQKDQYSDRELDPEVSKVLVDGRSNPDALDKRSNDANQTNPVEVILNGVQDMSAAMVGDYKVNDIALMALESMYRGLAFNRVVFFTMRKDRKKLEARFGFGTDIDHIVNQLSFETRGATNIFNIALAQGKDLIIEDTDKSHVKELIPQWFREKINTAAFIFLPITYEKNCLGAFYADREDAGPPLQAGQYKFVTMLRNQLILAIKYRR